MDHNILTDLYHHDVAATEVYNVVIKAVENSDESLTRRLREFLDDHHRHVDDLSKMIEEKTHQKPNETKNFKGMVLSGYSSLMSYMGVKNALKSLEFAEEVILKKYKEAALEKDTSQDVSALIKKNLSDEEKHLNFISGYIQRM